ncbi:MAG: MBL fold metallo-hydrolase, partial [Deltaproteobacteria bacterium]
MRITLLGTGTSSGIPVIGCDCAVCTSDDPRNKRLRCSALVETGTASLLIDTPPDLRIQALRYGIKRVDAVLYTHAHADHVHGIDELRAFNLRGGNPIACYASAETLKRIRCYFDYIFHQEDAESFRPQLVPSEISGPFEHGGVEVVPIPLMHGRMTVLGYRIGNVAYCPDCS